jgi:hypothetical protein
MSLARLIIEVQGNKIIVVLVSTKDKGRYAFHFKYGKAKVTIIRSCSGLIDDEGVVDIMRFKEECDKRAEEVYEMLMEEME